MVSDNPDVVDIVAFELTDTRDDDVLGALTIYDNMDCIRQFSALMGFRNVDLRSGGFGSRSTN